jgi:hypothetical protein
VREKMSKKGVFIFWILLQTLLLISCGIKATRFGNSNRKNIMGLSVNMTKEEVINTMGSQALTIGIAEEINNPYKTEVVSTKTTTYEVWYYFTGSKFKEGVADDDELTPIVFENDILIGWGWIYFKEKIKPYEVKIK